MKGIVRCVGDDNCWVGVEWFDWHGGHDLNKGEGPLTKFSDDSGWYITGFEHFKFLSNLKYKCKKCLG
jgi:hypothetical protein